MASLATLLRQAEPTADAVTLELTPDWMQGRTAFGGWQSALALKAMRQQVDAALPLRSLQSNFIAPVPPGPVRARAELLRRGKSAAQVEARIEVCGAVAFTALGIFGEPRASAVRLAPRARHDLPPPELLPDQPYLPGVSPAFLGHFDMRWARGAAPFSAAADGDACLYLRFRDQSAKDEFDLVALADAVPPSAYAMFPQPAPVSSMNWTVEVIRPPQPEDAQGWWLFDASTTAAGEGYCWESVSIWSPGGELAAMSRQCVALFA